jgi:type II secretory pathway component PulC
MTQGPQHKFRFLGALAVSGLVALGLSTTYFIIVLTGNDRPKVESPEQRSARCAAAPSGELVVSAEELAPLADSTALADGGKIRPMLTRGSTVGLEIFQIKPASLYDRAGLCEGDVVTSVGGIRLDTPEATLDAYEQLRDQKIIAIELLRRGAPASYRVRVE